MFRILLDENIPLGLRRLLEDHEVWHVRDTGWAGLSNGALIAAAEQAGFAIMITADRNLRYQQNLQNRRLALIVLNGSNWRAVRRSLDVINLAVEKAERETFQDVVLRDPTA